MGTENVANGPINSRFTQKTLLFYKTADKTFFNTTKKS